MSTSYVKIIGVGPDPELSSGSFRIPNTTPFRNQITKSCARSSQCRERLPLESVPRRSWYPPPRPNQPKNLPTFRNSLHCRQAQHCKNILQKENTNIKIPLCSYARIRIYKSVRYIVQCICSKVQYMQNRNNIFTYKVFVFIVGQFFYLTVQLLYHILGLHTNFLSKSLSFCGILGRTISGNSNSPC